MQFWRSWSHELLEPVRKGIRFPIRIRRASRRGRGGVFDQPIGVGRFHALQPTFLGLFSVIPIQLTKAVVENGSDVGPFFPLPIHLCDLCGSPPHPGPKTFSDGLLLVNYALLAADDNNVSVTSGEPELREPDQP
jgi:hypothetical protein